MSVRTATRPRVSVPLRMRAAWLAPATAVIFAVLATVSDVDFRYRDPRLALAGVSDTQIRVELVLWAFAAGFVAWQLLHDRPWLVHRFPAALGPSTRVFLLIAGVVLLSTLRQASVLPTVRALQLGTLVLLIALTYEVVRDHATMARWWIIWRRVFVALVTALTVASALLPHLRYDRVTYTGFTRLTIFYTHPIATATFLGVATIMIAGALLTVRDPWLNRRWASAGAGAVAAAAVALLIATRARGPIIGTVCAVVVLIALSRRRVRRGAAVLALLLVVAFMIGGMFDAQLHGTFVRGQSRSEILSLTGRTDLFNYAGELFAERPIFGYGYLAGRSIFLDRFPWAGESHNAIVDIGVSLGMVGLALYGLLFTTIARSLRSPFRRTGHGLAAEGWAMVAFLLVTGMLGESVSGSVGVDVVTFGAVVLLADTLRLSRRSARDTSDRSTHDASIAG